MHISAFLTFLQWKKAVKCEASHQEKKPPNNIPMGYTGSVIFHKCSLKISLL